MRLPPLGEHVAAESVVSALDGQRYQPKDGAHLCNDSVHTQCARWLDACDYEGEQTTLAYTTVQTRTREQIQRNPRSPTHIRYDTGASTNSSTHSIHSHTHSNTHSHTHTHELTRHNGCESLVDGTNPRGLCHRRTRHASRHRCQTDCP